MPLIQKATFRTTPTQAVLQTTLAQLARLRIKILLQGLLIATAAKIGAADGTTWSCAVATKCASCWAIAAETTATNVQTVTEKSRQQQHKLCGQLPAKNPP